MRQFLKTNTWDFAQIESLKIDKLTQRFAFGRMYLGSICSTFCNMLGSFDNLRYLELNKVDVRAGFVNAIENKFNSKGSGLLNKLEGLCLHSENPFIVRVYDALLSHTSEQLLSLHFDRNISAPVNGFKNLRELSIVNASESGIYNVIQTAKNLERVYLEFDDRAVPCDELEKALVELLSQPTLESISIEMAKSSYELVETVTNALQKIKFVKRKKFRGSFIINHDFIFVKKYFAIFQTVGDDLADDYVIRGMCLLNNVQKGEVVCWMLKNAVCKLNGYMARWLYPPASLAKS